MAVVTKYGSGYRDPAAVGNIDGVYRQSRLHAIHSKIDFTNGDTAASKYYIGSVPSNAIIEVGSVLYYEAVTGVNSIDVGFFKPNGGAVILVNALIAAKDITSAGSVSINAQGAVTTANSNKRAWEMAGLAADPGGELDIVATINANATATKSAIFNLRYGTAS